jgi:hypothetical protein
MASTATAGRLNGWRQMTDTTPTPPPQVFPTGPLVPAELPHPVTMDYSPAARATLIRIRDGASVREVRLDETVHAYLDAEGYVTCIKLHGKQSGALIGYLPRAESGNG